MTSPDSPISSGGGGIVFGGSRGETPTDGARDLPEFARALRRRWTTGVAVATTLDADGGYRGVTIGSLMMLSLDPPCLVLALATDSSFHELLPIGATFGISILDRDQEFASERFAGRAPVPDSRFAGISHDTHSGGIPILRESIGWAICAVTERVTNGDHVLIIGALRDGDLVADQDNPLISYEAQYRELEMR